MKIRFVDRLISGLTGLLLLALSAAVIAEVFFAVPLTAQAGEWIARRSAPRLIALSAVSVALILLGVHGIGLMLRRARNVGFVMQRTENGELSISVKAIEGLVHMCADKQQELRVVHTALDCCREGLIIRLKVTLAPGVSIPLAVNALQKQVRQYVTACSGVDVKEVKVQVEQEESKGKHSRYAVPEMLCQPAPAGEPIPAPEAPPVAEVNVPDAPPPAFVMEMPVPAQEPVKMELHDEPAVQETEEQTEASAFEQAEAPVQETAADERVTGESAETQEEAKHEDAE